MSKTYHFIGIKGSWYVSFGFDAPPNGTQGSRFRCGKILLHSTWSLSKQVFLSFLSMKKNITEDVELIAGNAFREDKQR